MGHVNEKCLCFCERKKKKKQESEDFMSFCEIIERGNKQGIIREE